MLCCFFPSAVSFLISIPFRASPGQTDCWNTNECARVVQAKHLTHSCSSRGMTENGNLERVGSWQDSLGFFGSFGVRSFFFPVFFALLFACWPYSCGSEEIQLSRTQTFRQGLDTVNKLRRNWDLFPGQQKSLAIVDKVCLGCSFLMLSPFASGKALREHLGIPAGSSSDIQCSWLTDLQACPTSGLVKMGKEQD